MNLPIFFSDYQVNTNDKHALSVPTTVCCKVKIVTKIYNMYPRVNFYHNLIRYPHLISQLELLKNVIYRISWVFFHDITF